MTRSLALAGAVFFTLWGAAVIARVVPLIIESWVSGEVIGRALSQFLIFTFLPSGLLLLAGGVLWLVEIRRNSR